METLENMKYQSISWRTMGIALLPSLLVILQFGQVLEEKAWYSLSLVILTIGVFLVIASYKKYGYITNLYLPCIGVIFLEFWMLSRWLMNPHSALLLMKGLFIMLSVPSLFILYRLRINLNKAIFLAVISFAVSLLLIIQKTTQPWLMFSLNLVEWLVYVFPLFTFSMLYALKFDISLILAVAVFEPFWISYNLDPLGLINHLSIISSETSFNLALFIFQVTPVLGFLIILPISVLIPITNKDRGWKQILASLLIIVLILVIRFTVLKEPDINYLSPLWLTICIYIIILWFHFLLPLSVRDIKKYNDSL